MEEEFRINKNIDYTLIYVQVKSMTNEAPI
jgi:hypothetical protein